MSRTIVFTVYCLVLVTLLTGCGVALPLINSDQPDMVVPSQKISNTTIIIDDHRLQGSDYRDKIVAIFKETLSKSFESVIINTGYDTPKYNEIILNIDYKPINFQTRTKHEGKHEDLSVDLEINVNAKSSTNNDKYYLTSHAGYFYSLAETFGGLAFGIATLGASAKAQTDLAKAIVVGKATSAIAIDFHNKLVSSKLLEETVNIARIKDTLPANLTLIAKFSDTAAFLPNNTLDAGEEAELLMTIKNTGNGAGYGTELELSADNPKVAFNKKLPIGDIQPGEEKEIKVKLKSSLDLADGKTPFTLNLKEKRGYDAKKVVINVPTTKLERPQLEIVSTEINDGDTGLAKGNGNGIPESGETVELIAFIRNNGQGKSIGVNLNGEELTSGVQWVKGSNLVGTIQPGETVKAKLAFAVARNFDAKEITFNLKVSDLRGVGDTNRKVACAIGKLAPDLHYAWRIFSKGEEVKSITNGGEYELELTLDNKGQIAARDVTVSLAAAAGANLSRTRIEAGEIKPQAAVPGQRLSLSVPRTFKESEAVLAVKIAQTDFPAARNSLRIPVELKSPKLRYIPTLRGKGGGNTLQQGELAILEIQVLNEGSLPAEGVKVKLSSMDPYLTIQGKAEELIGTIRPNAGETLKFQLSTYRRIQVGDAFLAVDITQNDFSPLNAQYALNIREEGADVIEVADEERTEPNVALSVGTLSGPAITLKSRIAETADENIRLAFDVADAEKNIDSALIKVMVNGMSIPLDEDAGVTAKPEKSKQIMAIVPLREGENRIVITARNTDYAQTRKEIAITRSAEDDVDTPPLTGSQNPDAVAMVIGISRYKNKEMPPVDYARRDAETVRNYLVKTLGYDENRIFDAYDEDADRTSLVAGLFDDIRSRVVPGKSDVFIYYSGHGMPDVDSKGAAKDAYLAPYDFRSTSTHRTGIALKELYEQLETLDARSVTVVMDACFSGMTDKGSLVKGISAVLEVSNPMLKLKNGTIFTASSSKEAARWYDKKRHGLFTYYFLQGMRGKADSDRNGQITKKELEEHIRRNVAEQSQYRQNPTAVGNPDTVLVRLK